MESSTGNGGPREYELVLAASAEADIDAAHAWLSMQVSIDYAERWQDGLFADLRRLTYHPTKFSVAPESDILGIELRRMLYYGPSGRRHRGQVVYRLLFRIDESQGDRASGVVYVLRVRHGSREPLAPV